MEELSVVWGWIGQFGLTGGLTVAIVYAVAKYAVIPIISKSLGNAIERYFSRGEQIMTKLDVLNEIPRALQDASHKSDKLLSMVGELVDDSVGKMDERLALSTFSTFQNSIHLRLFVFFWRRVDANHVISSPDLVWGRYQQKLDELKSKAETQMAKYYYKEHALDMFWGKGGTDSFFRHIGAELYNIQLLRAEGDAFCKSLTQDDLESAFDRLLSKLMGAFKGWLETGKTYQETKHQYNMHLFHNEQVNAEIEMFEKGDANDKRIY